MEDLEKTSGCLGSNSSILFHENYVFAAYKKIAKLCRLLICLKLNGIISLTRKSILNKHYMILRKIHQEISSVNFFFKENLVTNSIMQ